MSTANQVYSNDNADDADREDNTAEDEGMDGAKYRLSSSDAAPSPSSPPLSRLSQKRKKPESSSLSSSSPSRSHKAPGTDTSSTSTTTMSQSQKERRLQMSRINAQRNRDRKRVIIGMMQEDKNRLTVANAKLKDENELLRVVIATLKHRRSVRGTAAAVSVAAPGGATSGLATARLPGMMGINHMIPGLARRTAANFPSSADVPTAATAGSTSRPVNGPIDLLPQMRLLSQSQQQPRGGNQPHLSTALSSSSFSMPPAGVFNSLSSSPFGGNNNDPSPSLSTLLALLSGQTRKTDTQVLSHPSIAPPAIGSTPACDQAMGSSIQSIISGMASTPDGLDKLLRLAAIGGAGSDELLSILNGRMLGVEQRQQNSVQLLPTMAPASQSCWKSCPPSSQPSQGPGTIDPSEALRGLTIEQQLQLLTTMTSRQPQATANIQAPEPNYEAPARIIPSNSANIFGSNAASAIPVLSWNQSQDLSQNALLQQLLRNMQGGITTTSSISSTPPNLQGFLPSLAGNFVADHQSSPTSKTSSSSSMTPQNWLALSNLLRNHKSSLMPTSNTADVAVATPAVHRHKSPPNDPEKQINGKKW